MLSSLKFINIKNFLILFIMGAILGPICDGFHSHTDTLAYPEVWKFKMAWWVPLLFGSATVVVGYSHSHMDILWNKRRNFSWKFTLIGVFSFISIYFLSAILNLNELTKSSIIYVLAMLIWYFFDRTFYGLILAILTSIIGSLVEISLIFTQNFYYLPEHSHIWGIPYWLPALYIAASVTIGNFGRKLCINNK